MLTTQFRFSPARPWQRLVGWLLIHALLLEIWTPIALEALGDPAWILAGPSEVFDVVWRIGAAFWLVAAAAVAWMWFTRRQRFAIPVVAWALIFFTVLGITAAFD